MNACRLSDRTVSERFCYLEMKLTTYQMPFVTFDVS